MQQDQRTFKLIDVIDFCGKTHIRCSLFRLRTDGDDIDFFTRQHFRNVAQKPLTIVGIDYGNNCSIGIEIIDGTVMARIISH